MPDLDDQIAEAFAGWSIYAVPGWDGAGAWEVTAERVEQAKGIMREIGSVPDVGPGVDGSVCMEWPDLWIDVESDGRVTRFVPAPRPVPAKPTIPEVLAEFLAYRADEPAWGSLHIVLDDQNFDDDSVRFCIRWAREGGDERGARLAETLSRMSKTQRAKLSAMCGGAQPRRTEK